MLTVYARVTTAYLLAPSTPPQVRSTVVLDSKFDISTCGYSSTESINSRNGYGDGLCTYTELGRHPSEEARTLQPPPSD